MAPEKIEGVYARSPFVAQSFVHGNSLQAQLVAVVVPDPEHLLPWAAARKLPGDLKALCANKVVADAVLRSMQEEGRAAKLNSFEQVSWGAWGCVRMCRQWEHEWTCLWVQPIMLQWGVLLRPQLHMRYRPPCCDLWGNLTC